jgi:hypothetical protein
VGNSGGSSGGSSGGTRRTLKFPFAFDTPNLLTGAALYTPTVGDVLHDAWFEIDMAWDGTTPLGDFGTFVGVGYGFMKYLAVAQMDMTQADNDGYMGGGFLFGPQQFSNMRDVSAIGGLVDAVQQGVPFKSADIPSTPQAAAPLVNTITPVGWAYWGQRGVGKFTAANPIQVVVSQSGMNTGADPGSTQGSAVLYLDISTPA